MFTKPKPAQTLTDYPAYIEATDKLDSVKHKLSRVEAKIEAWRVSRTPAATQVAEQARALLSQGSVAVADAPTTETIDELQDQRRVLCEAVQQQVREVETTRAAICREIARAALPEYQSIVREMVETFAPFGAACEKEAAFRDRFTEQGISFASIAPPVPLNGTRLSVYASDVNRWLDQVEKDYGVIVKNRRRQP
ncbi:MAG: hypothetical protein Q7S20_01300 [Gemmatimonadaceae bacterium]|nr:hypothetical protein [Gemmatimonadaceae bacterium]